jgi:hypothetical protein
LVAECPLAFISKAFSRIVAKNAILPKSVIFKNIPAYYFY